MVQCHILPVDSTITMISGLRVMRTSLHVALLRNSVVHRYIDLNTTISTFTVDELFIILRVATTPCLLIWFSVLELMVLCRLKD